jgi:hypothetical protein
MRVRRADQRNESKMIYIASGLLVIWFGGFLFLAARSLNYTRLVLNSLAPGENYWDSGVWKTSFGVRISGAAVDPASLTEVGRQHRKGAIRNDRITFVWGVGGFILIACFFSYIQS